MKSGIWIALIVIVGIIIVLIAFMTFRNKLAELERPKSWWEDLGIEIGPFGVHL